VDRIIIGRRVPRKMVGAFGVGEIMKDIFRFLGGVGVIGNTMIAFLTWYTNEQEIYAWIWMILGFFAIISLTEKCGGSSAIGRGGCLRSNLLGVRVPPPAPNKIGDVGQLAESSDLNSV